MDKSKIIISLLVVLVLLIITFLCGFWLGKNTNENAENQFIQEYISNETQNEILEEYHKVDDVSKILDNPSNDNLQSRRDKIIQDEKEYGENYQKFTNFELYSRKPDRIIFKQGDKEGFFIFEKDDKAYEHLLVVIEDRMAYSSYQDYNLSFFKPESINTIETSTNNYIIYDYDNGELGWLDPGYQKDIIFKFNSGNRLYRLISYLAEFKESVSKKDLGKDEFAYNPEDSGYHYMTFNPNESL